MAKMKCGIYEIRNLVTNKVYIGSSKVANLRINNHRHCLNKNIHANCYLQSAWNKYGKDAFEFKIIQRIENEVDLLKYEQLWMDWTECYKEKFGYNLNPIAGSNLGYSHTEETKLKISQIHKGRLKSEETIIRMKANSPIRNKEKWPHELGKKCKCKDCYAKTLQINAKWKRDKRWWYIPNVKTT